MAATRAWIRFCGMKDLAAAEIRTALVAAGLDLAHGPVASQPGIVCFSDSGDELLDLLREARQSGIAVLALGASPDAPNPDEAWRLLDAGASDTLVWHDDGSAVLQILARLERWNTIDALSIDAARRVSFIGASRAWTAVTRRVVEAARFTDAPVLLIGESGTGKELLARLIHLAGTRAAASSGAATDPVTVDCSTIVPELSGSEFFGHEKGAFTGAVASRDGAFAAADQGTLFLDEVGELPIGLQVQLLRVVQEKTYKRVGGNVWQRTDFRLVSATNRNLAELVAHGQFRLDLYHRLAGWVFRLPALRERREDILSLAAHFLGECGAGGEPPAFDDSVCAYLVNRDYPGNVRELRQLVHRIAHRHAGPGPITAGDIPPEDRPVDGRLTRTWPDERLDQVINDALTRGFGLKEIGYATTETAIRLALLSEKGNLRRAAKRLGVTDRALQLRRQSGKPRAERRRPGDEAQEISAEYQRTVRIAQAQREHFAQLHAGMQPRPIRSEQNLFRSGALERLFEDVETPNRRRVRVDIGMPRQRIDEGLLRRPVVRETPKMRKDEIDVRILVGEQLGDRHLAGRIVEHRQPELAGGAADLRAQSRVVPMDLDSDKAVLLHCRSNHRAHAPGIPLRVDEREAPESFRTRRHDLRDFAVRERVVGMEGGEEDSAVDPRAISARQVFAQRRVRIPRTGQAVPFSRVAVAVDDHARRHTRLFA